MIKSIQIHNKNINYQLKTSPLAKNMRLCIYADGRFIVTRPLNFSDKRVEKFIIKKSSWVLEKIKKISSNKSFLSPIESRKIYLKHKETARIFIEEKVRYFSEFYGLNFNRIAIRDQKTCWGSCSKKRNLNFNYKIMFLPEHLVNYIIAHEVCHLKEMNHSRRFWDLLSQSIPNYYNTRRELKKVILEID